MRETEGGIGESEGESEEGEERGGDFVDLLASDACLALGRLATNGDVMSIAFKQGAKIASVACTRYYIHKI